MDFQFSQIQKEATPENNQMQRPVHLELCGRSMGIQWFSLKISNRRYRVIILSDSLSLVS